LQLTRLWESGDLSRQSSSRHKNYSLSVPARKNRGERLQVDINCDHDQEIDGKAGSSGFRNGADCKEHHHSAAFENGHAVLWGKAGTALMQPEEEQPASDPGTEVGNSAGKSTIEQSLEK
jgi:hypothetical protein